MPVQGWAAGAQWKLHGVDQAVEALKWKAPVLAATAGALPANTASPDGLVLTADVNGALPAIDGVAVAVGDRVLVKDEGGGTDPRNGIYEVTDLGSAGTPWVLTRTADANTGTELCAGAATIATEGTQAETLFVLATDNPITIGVTALTFAALAVGTLTVEEEGAVVDPSTVVMDFVGDTLTATQTAPGEVQVEQTTAAPNGLSAGQANAEGVSSSVARADHDHGVPTAAPVNVDKSANAEGAAASFARSDHKHDVSTAVAATISGNANAEGASSDLARADHTHMLTTAAPSVNEVPIWDGGDWVAGPQRGSECPQFFGIGVTIAASVTQALAISVLGAVGSPGVDWMACRPGRVLSVSLLASISIAAPGVAVRVLVNGVVLIGPIVLATVTGGVVTPVPIGAGPFPFVKDDQLVVTVENLDATLAIGPLSLQASLGVEVDLP